MKKLSILCMALLAVLALRAQPPVKQSARVTLEQVPVAVQQSYQKDFGELPADGHWTVFAETTTSQGSRTETRPLWYAYNRRGKGEKVELRFLPTGELTFSKGISRVNAAPVTDSVLQEKKKIG